MALWTHSSMGDGAIGPREQAAEGARLDPYFEYLGNSGCPGAWHSGRNGERLQSVTNAYCSVPASVESGARTCLSCGAVVLCAYLVTMMLLAKAWKTSVAQQK